MSRFRAVRGKVLGSSPLDCAKRLRNDRIKARSPLMEGCLIECQNTAYVRNLLQIEDDLYANARFDSGVESRFSSLTPLPRFARLVPQHIHWRSAHLPRFA